jgi:hypothetical protein
MQLINFVGVIKFMAKEYFEKLSALVHELDIENEISAQMEIKHFFSGAALYVNGKIRVTWSPVGLAFKLPTLEVSQLIDRGEAIPLKYFPDGNEKKGYALIENHVSRKPSQLKKYFLMAARQPN